jgi:peptidoglycan/xylan/chitin deacetylase (PgdA/CDA1 family)
MSENEDSTLCYGKPPVLLGFDDGFRTVIVNGLPILAQFNAPAIFFVVASVLKDPDFVPWFVEVRHILRKAKHKQIVYRGVDLDLTCRQDIMRVRRVLERNVRACRSEDERQRLLTAFATVFGVRRPIAAELDQDLRLVTRGDLGQLDGSPILAVGSHAMTHRHLADLSYEDQQYELSQSDSILREHSQVYCPVVAYPSGSFNATTVGIARDIYKAGFGVFLGSSYRNRFAYPRVGLGQHSAGEVAYVLSSVRLNWLLPIRKWLHVTGLRRVDG